MKLSGLLAGLWLAAACANPAQGAEDAYRWSVRYMLVNGTDDTTLFAPTQGLLRHSTLRTPEMRELLAELLAQVREHELPAQEAALNIVKVLEAAPDAGRYLTLIANQKKFLTAEGSGPLVRHYLFAHRKYAGEQFVPGKLDLAKLRKQYIDAALAARPTAAQVQALRSLPSGATIDEMFASAGMPSHVMPRDTRAAMRYGNMDVQQVYFFYRGIGRVTYEYDVDAWRLLLVDIDPLAFENLMPYRHDSAAHGQPDDARLQMMQLLNGGPYAIRTSAMATSRLEAASREYLDTAAELLLTTHAQAKHAMAVDAYSWLCNVLTHHDKRRYAAVLARVARETSDPKLKRYAGKGGGSKGANSKRAAYVPGSVTLEEQRARYPSLYSLEPAT